MKTPYPKVRAHRADLLLWFHQWNAANERARQEYEEHPTVACIQPGCDELCVTPRRNNCPAHAKEQAAERMRLRRRKAAK